MFRNTRYRIDFLSMKVNDWCFMPKLCHVGYVRLRTTWANEMNFVMNHAPRAGSIARPVDQKSNALPLRYGCPLMMIMMTTRRRLRKEQNASFALCDVSL